MNNKKAPSGKNGTDSAKPVLGLWETDKAPLSLGGLLIFAEELLIRRTIHQALNIDLAIIVKHEELNKYAIANYPPLKAIRGIEGVGKYFIADKPGLKHMNANNKYFLWPSENIRSKYSYGTTIYIHEYFKKFRRIPFLHLSGEYSSKAREFIRRRILPRIPVVVHLKNNPLCTDCSNADFDQWHNFFLRAQRMDDILFILIGKDKIPAKITSLPNVLQSNQYGMDLGTELALIEQSFIFMGTASGPCNVAIFNSSPYVIYKDPKQHPDEMKAELGSKDHFPFAHKYQNIFRMDQNANHIFQEFTKRNTLQKKDRWLKNFGINSANIKKT